MRFCYNSVFCALLKSLCILFVRSLYSLLFFLLSLTVSLFDPLFIIYLVYPPAILSLSLHFTTGIYIFFCYIFRFPHNFPNCITFLSDGFLPAVAMGMKCYVLVKDSIYHFHWADPLCTFFFSFEPLLAFRLQYFFSTLSRSITFSICFLLFLLHLNPLILFVSILYSFFSVLTQWFLCVIIKFLCFVCKVFCILFLVSYSFTFLSSIYNFPFHTPAILSLSLHFTTRTYIYFFVIFFFFHITFKDLLDFCQMFFFQLLEWRIWYDMLW